MPTSAVRRSSKQMQPTRATAYRVDDKATIEAGQLTAVRAGQSQQITVGHLARAQQARSVHAFGVEQADVVGPERVAWQGAQGRHQLGHCGRRAR